MYGDTREQIANHPLFTKVSPKMELMTKISTEIISRIYKDRNHRQHVSQKAIFVLYSPPHMKPEPTHNRPTS